MAKGKKTKCKPVALGVRVPGDVIAGLDQLAAADERSRSGYVGRLLAAHVERARRGGRIS